MTVYAHKHLICVLSLAGIVPGGSVSALCRGISEPLPASFIKQDPSVPMHLAGTYRVSLAVLCSLQGLTGPAGSRPEGTEGSLQKWPRHPP